VQPTQLSLTARTLYAELRELALAIGSVEHRGDTPGSIVTKTLGSGAYLYWQYRDLDGHTRQSYLGPDGERTRELAARRAMRTATTADDLARLDELRAAFVGAGGGVMEHAPLRVLKGFADAGLLQPGVRRAVLVGTHAFNVLGNLLGVRWLSQMQTQDIDLAGEADIDIAVSNPTASAPEVLQQLDMGFIPVPTLDPRSPSTSFRVRGQELRVDLLVPLTGKPSSRPVYIPALNAMGQPLRFLDYLLIDPVPAVVAGRRAMVLLSVPAPERFALHKLLVSESRSTAFAVKAGKDREQAMQLLAALIEDAPDGVAAAKADLMERGAGWSGKLVRALNKVRRTHSEVVGFVESLK
jgi:hypothetical protein